MVGKVSIYGYCLKKFCTKAVKGPLNNFFFLQIPKYILSSPVRSEILNRPSTSSGVSNLFDPGRTFENGFGIIYVAS